MKFAKHLLLAALLVTVGCASDRTAENQRNLDKQAQFAQANVGMGFIIAPAMLDSVDGVPVMMDLASEPNRPDTLKNVVAFTHQTYAWPLNYSVQNIGGYEFGGWNAKQPITISPAPGEIVYAGHIILTPHYSLGSEKYIDIRVEDRWEDYSRMYNLPEAWKGKVQKRLLQMPARVPLVISQKPR